MKWTNSSILVSENLELSGGAGWEEEEREKGRRRRRRRETFDEYVEYVNPI